MEEDLDLFGTIEMLLTSLSYHLQSKEEILKVWVHLGEKIGVQDIFPHSQVVITQDEDGNYQPVMMVSSPTKELVDYITDSEFLTDGVVAICLDDIKKLGH
jgi:hypothetical protein